MACEWKRWQKGWLGFEQMLYWFAESYTDSFGWLNLFSYVTTRSMCAAFTGMIVGFLSYPAFIRWQRNASLGQHVREDGPDSHFAKAGTPTMGGIVILAAMLTATLLWGDLKSTTLWSVIAALALFAAIGFVDDWRKFKHASSKGLSAGAKLALQFAAAVLALSIMWTVTPVGNHSGILVPYWKDLVLPLGAVGFFALGLLCIVGASNAVNLADGLDGLAIMPSVLICSGLAILAYVAGHNVFADYLGLPSVPGSQELVIFCAAFAGAGLAFLWYNAGPAQVFMGDTGSLAIGAALAAIAVAVRQELVFAIMAGLFVLEAVSVILQVGSYKLTGKRIFRMAPLHHHFEEKGWPENVVVVRFWIITIVLVLIGLASMKIR